jgi:aldehyde dehydrogenase (NAD+)
MFERQKRYFATGATRSLGWRVEQLDRMARLVGENESALQRAVAKDFKTASQERIFETLACLGEVAYQKSQLRDWMAPTEAPVPRALAATGHRGIVYRDPYGVALIIGPFNGPLLLLLRPAITALAAGNCCVLKLSEKLNSTSALLLDLVPKYFEPDAVAAVTGHRASGRRESDAGPARTRRSESRTRRRNRQHSGCREENCMGRDGVGRAMVHVARLCLRARVGG